ncbi:MAG: FAD-dependent oxidoreductase, partial [Rhodobacteraceae bacterium]|nr:FAD-dependent oxidoreductase [Paracoccaceae bacterium]
ADGAPLGNGVKGQAALFGVEWGAGVDYGALPQIYLPGLHIIAHRDGTVAVGSTSERYWQEATTTDGALEDLIARARAVLPILADAPVLRRWAGLRPRAASRAPILGKHPAIKGDYIANGGFMIGLAMAPNVGAVIADFILTGEDRIIPEMRVPV